MREFSHASRITHLLLMIEITDLSYTYPKQTKPALQEVSLRVGAGEFVLLAGESGSGKSTLLRSLNGLVPHLSGGTIAGQVRVNGLDVVAVGPQQMSRHVGFVFQNPEGQAVLDRVEAEIAFGLESRTPSLGGGGELAPSPLEGEGWGEGDIRREMQARVAEVMDLLGLTALRERPLRSLSGGERQKVALASALVLRPSLLVLDEPTSQLDPQAAAELLDLLVRLNRELGLTIVLAEHRLERVLPFVHRVVYVENGRITLDGPVPETVLKLPHVPPVIALARQLGWQPIPLTVADAVPFIKKMETLPPQKAATHKAATDALLLDVKDLNFAYSQQGVLQKVCLQVRAGELVALLGHNGAGKSTLLRCVVGLLQGQGEIMVNGRSTQNLRVAEICRDVAYLPQNPDDLLFASSVAEELAVTLANHGMATDGVVIDRLLAELGLAETRTAYPRDLSVGQRQRVALGAVAVTEPPLILLDEPTRGLDAGAKLTLAAIWERWLAQGRGILLVTHDVELVAQVAHRVVILQAGRVVAEGDTAVTLAQHPMFTPQYGRLLALTS